MSDFKAEDQQVFAWMGDDEFRRQGVGLKQAVVPAGLVPLVSVRQDKLARPEIRQQLQEQANAYNTTIKLVRFVGVEVLETITPEVKTT